MVDKSLSLDIRFNLKGFIGVDHRFQIYGVDAKLQMQEKSFPNKCLFFAFDLTIHCFMGR
jgi:hypothetical protein